LAQVRRNEITATSAGEPPRRCCLPDSEYGFDGALSPYSFTSQLRLAASRLLLDSLALLVFGSVLLSQASGGNGKTRPGAWWPWPRPRPGVLDNRHGMSTAVLHPAQPATREIPLKREGDTSRGTWPDYSLSSIQRPNPGSVGSRIADSSARWDATCAAVDLVRRYRLPALPPWRRWRFDSFASRRRHSPHCLSSYDDWTSSESPAQCLQGSNKGASDGSRSSAIIPVDGAEIS